MRNKRTKEMTITATLAAIVIVLGLVPNLGFISINPMVGFTIIHIPVFIGAYYGGRRVGGTLGLIFGLTSFFVAITRPTTMLAPIFTNPLVSVLPRFLVGYFAFDVLQFFRKTVKPKVVTDALYFGTMTLLHAFLVITLLYIAGINNFYFDVYGLQAALENELTREGTVGVINYVSTYLFAGGTFFGFLLTIVVVNSLLEVVACTLIGVPVVDRLEVVLGKNE